MSEESKRDNEAGAEKPASAPDTESPASAPASAPESAPAETAPAAAAESPASAPAAATGEPGTGTEGETPRRKETEEEKAARRKAALEAREAAKAAAAQAKAAEAIAAQSAGTAPATPAAGGEGAAADAPPPKPPSPNQPRLDRAVALLRELLGDDTVEESYINETNDHLPTLVVKNERWAEAARLFRDHEELGCDYLRNVSGVDYETHMEVVYYPLNMKRRETWCIKVRADREQPEVSSATPVWETANWNEREIFDLLGIRFPGHPNLVRIMMPDDWVGHPLRKDYVPLDPEV